VSIVYGTETVVNVKIVVLYLPEQFFFVFIW